MSKLDDAYNRLQRFEKAFRTVGAFTAALWDGYSPADGGASFDEARLALCDDLKAMLGAVEDREEYREILSDLVTDESEKRAIGGGPNWRERHEKTWARAMELFEP